MNIPEIQNMQPEAPPPTPVKDMAYGGTGNATSFGDYRASRTVPFTRRGVIQTAIPQFKGLYLYTPAAGHNPTLTNPVPTGNGVPAAYKQTMIYTRIRIPITPGKQITTDTP